MSVPTPTRDEHRLRAIADMIHAENLVHGKLDPGLLGGIVHAINGLTSAMLALSADGPVNLATPIADLHKHLIDFEAAATPPKEPADRGEVIDYDGAGPARWECGGCRARRHADSWAAHIHLVERCTDPACPDNGQRPHAHKTRDNIIRYTGALCEANDCPHAKYEHAHWFEIDNPDSPGDPRWLARA